MENAPVDIAPMAFEHAQQVIDAHMDVAQDVAIPVTAPTHMAAQGCSVQLFFKVLSV
jgi:hypothetical protein